MGVLLLRRKPSKPTATNFTLHFEETENGTLLEASREHGTGGGRAIGGDHCALHLHGQSRLYRSLSANPIVNRVVGHLPPKVASRVGRPRGGVLLERVSSFRPSTRPITHRMEFGSLLRDVRACV